MGHTIKGQLPHMYRPSTTRRVSGLSPINERRENARRRWNSLRQTVKRASQIQRNIRTLGYAKRGRFTVRNSSPKKSPKNKSAVSMWKHASPGVYFMSQPYMKGRFTVENIKGFVPWPKKKSPRR
jgi:pyruvate dehydrogenase complex dehydrogenase (E1) component